MSVFWICLAAYVGYEAGWIIAHYTVAQECQRLGSFFVGEKTYKCVEIIEDSSAAHTERKP